MKKGLIPSSTNEFDNYTLSSRASINTDPLNKWNKNPNDYSILSRIADDFFASQPSSTSSYSDDFIILDRSKLAQEKVSKLIEL